MSVPWVEAKGDKVLLTVHATPLFPTAVELTQVEARELISKLMPLLGVRSYSYSTNRHDPLVPVPAEPRVPYEPPMCIPENAGLLPGTRRTSVVRTSQQHVSVRIRETGNTGFQTDLTPAQAKELAQQLQAAATEGEERLAPAQPKPWAHIDSTLGSVYVQARNIESVMDVGADKVHMRMLGGNIHVIEGTTADQIMKHLTEGQEL